MSKSMLSLLVLCLLVHCSIKNPADDIKVKLSFDSIELTISGQIIDAVTNARIEIPVNLAIQGNGHDKIVDVYGHEQTSFKSENGFFQFGLKKGMEPSAENPVEVIVLASADGFLSSNTTLIIDKNTDINFNIRMINLTAAPASLEKIILENVNTDENGALLADAILTCGGGPNTGGASVTLSLAKGTLLKDDQGQPVTGTLTLQMFYFNDRTPDCYRYFPGGTSASIERDANGQSLQDVFMRNIGFFSLHMVSNTGQRISAIDPGINVNCEIPPDMQNPLTNQLIKPGDELPVWNYNSLTGKWIFDQMAIVGQEQETPDALLKSGHIFKLDAWGLGFLSNPLVLAGIVAAAIAIPLAISDDDDYVAPERCDFGWLYILKNPHKLHLDLSIQYFNTPPLRNNLIFKLSGYAVGGSETYEHTLPNLWGSDSILIEDGNWDSANIFAYYDSAEVGLASFYTYCDSETRHNLEVILPDIETITATIDITARCERNPDLVLLPVVPVYCRKIPSPTFRFAGIVKRGTLTIPGLELGREYEFGVTYKELYADTVVTITHDLEHVRLELNIPREECP